MWSPQLVEVFPLQCRLLEHEDHSGNARASSGVRLILPNSCALPEFLGGKVGMMKQQIAARIQESLTEGKLPCPSAFKVARRLEVSPQQVGEVADELRVKISRCQLGLFGYGSNKGKSLEPTPEVGEQLEARIRDRVTEEELPCATAWDIASELTMKRISVARAAESMGIRITQCQLGCFR